MAKKTKTKRDGGTLGDIAAGLTSMLADAEKQWRAWQGPRDALVRTVTDVRDRADALLSEMGTVTDAAAGKGSKKGKKKDKKDKKAKKDKKDKRSKKAKKGKKAGAETAADAPTTAPASAPAADVTGPDAGNAADPGSKGAS